MKGNQERPKKDRNKNLYYGFSFLVIVIILYLVLAVFDLEKISMSLHVSYDIFIQILPILFVVILLMGVVNYFLKPKSVSKYLGIESGVKGWFIAISMGILSHGPIYVWYPLLKDLRDHGMRTGLVAVFLHNRAIKIPLLPVMIFYFGLGFVVILSIYMMIASIIEGKIIEIINPHQI
jgi:uncharacterized membrane protein YraQ (UPF0718 family)